MQIYRIPDGMKPIAVSYAPPPAPAPVIVISPAPTVRWSAEALSGFCAGG